jgi:alpha-beta hydrolase superfamily lysophospholipase/predicted GNAT family N-acyltransferase
MNAAKDSASRATTRPARAEPARVKAARRIDIRLDDWTALQAQAGPIRTAVFVQEQGIAPELEWDENDAHCVHCLALVDGEPAGTGRLLPDGHIGRMAVLPAHRRAGLGSLVLLALMQAAAQRGDARVALSAQTAVRDFYRAHGFLPEGEVYDEVGIPHQAMSRALWGGDITLREWTARGEGEGGQTLQVREWRPARGHGEGLYLLHGLGEHSGRYDALARWLCVRGWTVRAHDHAGHGASGGPRGVLDRPDRLRRDAAAQLAGFAAELGRPAWLLGHSMGGAMAAELVAAERVPVAGLVLSSPALAVDLAAPMRAAVSVLQALAPSLALGNGLDADRLSHDAAAVRAYREDPLVHDRISARLIGWIRQAGERARAGASTLTVPTLLLVAGDDAMVQAEGSHAFARAAPAGTVRLHGYDGLYHELFNEAQPGRDAVLDDLDHWLRERLSAGARSR